MTHIEQSKALKPRRPMSTAPPAPLAAVTSKCIHQPYQPLRRCLALQPSPSHRLPSRASLGSSPPPFLYDLRIRHGPAQPSSAVLMPSCPHALIPLMPQAMFVRFTPSGPRRSELCALSVVHIGC